MTVQAALIFVTLLMFVAVVMYRLWRFSASTNTASVSLNTTLKAPAGVDDKEWAVLLAKRQEFENDPMQDEQSKVRLRTEWVDAVNAVVMRNSNKTALTQNSPLPNSLRLLIGSILTFGVAMYIVIGRWDAPALQWYSAQQDTPTAGKGKATEIIDPNKPHPGSDETMEKRVEALKERLIKQPDDLEGWVLLARSLSAQRRFDDSAKALEQALRLAPGHPDLLADLADMTAMSNNKSMKGKPIELVEQALKNDPHHEKALALAATAAIESGDKTKADEYWSKLRDIQAKNKAEELAGGGASGAAQAPQQLAKPQAQQQVQTDVKPSASATGKSLQGQVLLSDEFKNQLKSKQISSAAIVYVVAKNPAGPPMPIAVARFPAAALLSGGTQAFTLDDSMSMGPTGQKLSELAEVSLEARLSMSGQANRSPGDWMAKPVIVKLGQNALTIQLDSVVQ